MSLKHRFVYLILFVVACIVLSVTYVYFTSSNTQTILDNSDLPIYKHDQLYYSPDSASSFVNKGNEFPGKSGDSVADKSNVELRVDDEIYSKSATPKTEFKIQNTRKNLEKFSDDNIVKSHTNKDSNKRKRIESTFNILDDTEMQVDSVVSGNMTVSELRNWMAVWRREEEEKLSEERRQLVEAKRKLLDEKIRFQQEVSQLMQSYRQAYLDHDNIVNSSKIKLTSPQLPLDPSLWEGLNSTDVHARYPGIIFLHDYKGVQDFVTGKSSNSSEDPSTYEEMSEAQAEKRFFEFVTSIHIACIVIRRMGNVADGGWDICTVPPYELKPGCLVYSFGINYDFTFDDALESTFDCTVKAFDPRIVPGKYSLFLDETFASKTNRILWTTLSNMSVGDHVRSAKVHFYQLGIGSQNTVTTEGWKLRTLQSIKQLLRHTETAIDILKMDIEFNEWDCLKNMIAERSLNNVKQLLFEIHTPEVQMIKRQSTKDDFADMYAVLSDLEKVGFRRYHLHMNPLGQYRSEITGRLQSCCFELYYLNIRFLRT